MHADQIYSDPLFVPTLFVSDLFHKRQCFLLHTIVSGFWPGFTPVFAGRFTCQRSLKVFRPDGFAMQEGHDEPRIASLDDNSRKQGKQNE